MPKKHTLEFVINSIKEKYNDEYDTSYITEYEGNKMPLHLFCKKHGCHFFTAYQDLAKGHACPECGKEKRIKAKTKSTEKFIQDAVKVYGDKYDYSMVNMEGRVDKRNEKIPIICYEKDEFGNEHGIFHAYPSVFLAGHSCPKCAKNETKTIEYVKRKSLDKFGKKYGFIDSTYKGMKTEMNIICPIHGIIHMSPENHLKSKCGCHKCAKKVVEKEDIFKRLKEVHGDKYTIDEDFEFNGMRKKIKINCPIHGGFWMRPFDLLVSKQGCPKCKASKLEVEIRDLLEKNPIKIEEQKTFDWLIYKDNLYIDFYLPEYKIGIECQGEQHFRPIDFFGGEENFSEQIKRDEIKKNLCKAHGITILYFSDKEHENVFADKQELINEIKKYGKNC